MAIRAELAVIRVGLVAIQVEAEPRARETADGQRGFAAALASAVLAWLRIHCAWEADSDPPAPE